MKIEERKIGQITKMVKIVVETVEDKHRPKGKTKLLKPRLTSLWSSKEYGRWKVEIRVGIRGFRRYP